MNWKVLENKVQAPNGETVEFQYPIKQAEEVAGVFVVILQVPPKESMTENVFGISAEGKIIWKIERIRETATDPVDCYVGIVNKGNWVRIGNWNGTVVEVDLQTGEVLRSKFLK